MTTKSMQKQTGFAPRQMASIIAMLLLGAAVLPAGAEELGFRGGMIDALGGRFLAQPMTNEKSADAATVAAGTDHATTSTQRLKYWSNVSMEAMKLDHTPVAPGDTRVYGEQFGPHRSSRVMAIVHIAVFDAVNAVLGGYQGYAYRGRVPNASVDAAIAQASHDTLVALYPSQRAQFDAQLVADLAVLPNDNHKSKGVQLGKDSAAAILALRANDGSQAAEPRLGDEFATSDQPGKWRQDPVSQVPLAVGAYWGRVRPFVLRTASQFRIPAPPPLDSPQYTTAYDATKTLGSDSQGARSDDQTVIGIYWAYDGTAGIGAPPRQYSQVTWTVAKQTGTDRDLLQSARLMALVNVAQADAAIAAWESKYYYQVWRPVTGVRESDTGTGPTGLGDSNDNTHGDPNFMPLGAPADNVAGPNFTPPFPSYPSGHASLGGALFGTLRNFYGRDNVPFTFVSDEYNGVTRDNQGNVRPLLPRSFQTFSQAEEENGMSRIYLGVHWMFDKTEGIRLGRRVADYVFKNAFQPNH